MSPATWRLDMKRKYMNTDKVQWKEPEFATLISAAGGVSNIYKARKLALHKKERFRATRAIPYSRIAGVLQVLWNLSLYHVRQNSCLKSTWTYFISFDSTRKKFVAYFGNQMLICFLHHSFVFVQMSRVFHIRNKFVETTPCKHSCKWPYNLSFLARITSSQSSLKHLGA